MYALLQRSGDARATPAPVVERARDEREDDVLACAVCDAAITRICARITRRGAHAHDCVNPAGIAFRVGCFRSAAGCLAVGPASTEATWFPPAAWRIALCASCHAHLGWRFEAADDVFHGLVLDRLVARAV